MDRMMAFMTRRRLAAVVLVALSFGAFYPVWADLIGPGPKDKRIALTVTSLLRREHLSRHPLDAEMARRAVTTLLKTLDPMKVYFYQSDVDTFMAREDEIENLAKRGDASFAYTVFQTFLKRIDERVKLVEEFLHAQHDFTADEDMLVDRESLQYPKTEAEAREKWRKRIKYDLLVSKADELEAQQKKARKEAAAKEGTAKDGPAKDDAAADDPKDDAVTKLARRYRTFAKRMHQTDSEELLEMYLTAVTSSFDPHTSYMSPNTLENFDIQMGLKLEGIGAALQSIDGYTVVNKLIPGGPAEKDARIKVKDRVVGVGQGTEGRIEDVVEMKLADVVKLIRGKAGTIVRLEVSPEHGSSRKIVALTRAEIDLKDSEARGRVFEEGRRADGKPYKIGVIDLPSFYMDMAGARAGRPEFRSTTRDVRKILLDFNQQGVDSLILDLRRNGGGSLQEAINLTGLFVGEGAIVQVKGADGRVQPYNDTETDMVWKKPMSVLISKFSASASEILAGAIQDYHRGLIIGDHSTHGKGTVQSLLDLGEQLFRTPDAEKLGALKITMQQFYRPNGDSTQRRGVLADVELPSITTHLDVGEADLDFSLAFDHVEPMEYKPFGFVEKPMVDRLKQLSSGRVSKSEDFQKRVRDIVRYEEQKKRKVVTLNEKKFMTERAEMNADKEEEKKIEEMSESNGAEIKRDYYLNEAMAIATDYMASTNPAQPVQAAQVAPPVSNRP
jgi:carboxyl-terminal processing protease